MRQRMIVSKEPAVGWLIIGFILLMLWRFFTGAHMNGKTYFDTLFWKDASRRYQFRQVAFSKWKRKARVKRMAWRNAFFWPVALVTYGCIVAPDIMLIVTFWLSPVYCWYLFKYIRSVFMEEHRGTFNEGEHASWWALKRKYQWMRFGWLRDPEDIPVTAKAVADEDHEDIHIISLKTLMDLGNPHDDEEG